MPLNNHDPYDLGYTRTTMAGTKGCNNASWGESRKAGPSPGWSLQLDSMKAASLVIANQHVAENTLAGLVHTARHTMGVDSTRNW